MTLRFTGLAALAIVAAACLDLVDLPPENTPSTRETLAEVCGCAQFEYSEKLREVCGTLVEAVPDDAKSLDLAAGVCADCGASTFDDCWSALAATSENELCATADACVAPERACATDGECCSGACVNRRCSGCEAGQPVGSPCRSSVECASLSCRIELLSLVADSRFTGECSTSCAGCGVLLGDEPDSGNDLCLSAAAAAFDYVDCLCGIERDPEGQVVSSDGVPEECKDKPGAPGPCAGAQMPNQCWLQVLNNPSCHDCVRMRVDCSMEAQTCALTRPEPAVGE